MHDQTSLLAPLCVFLVRRGGSGDRILFRYPFADPKTGAQFELLFRIDKTSLGVSRIGPATPWDDCPYSKSNANTFVRAHAYRVFLTSCVGSTRHPSELHHPRDVPSVDPSTLGQKTLYELALLKYCYNAPVSQTYLRAQ